MDLLEARQMDQSAQVTLFLRCIMQPSELDLLQAAAIEQQRREWQAEKQKLQVTHTT